MVPYYTFGCPSCFGVLGEDPKSQAEIRPPGGDFPRSQADCPAGTTFNPGTFNVAEGGISPSISIPPMCVLSPGDVAKTDGAGSSSAGFIVGLTAGMVGIFYLIYSMRRQED